MVIDLLTLIILATICWNISKTNRQRKNYMEEQKTATATSIKYDKRLMKAYTIAIFIIGIIFAISLWLMNMDNDFWGDGWFSEVVQVAVMCGLLLGGLMLILFAYMFLDGFFYLKRLKAHGYEIPDDKREYDCMLEQLPRTAGETFVEQDKTTKNKTSRALMWLCVPVGLVMLGFTLFYFYKWRFMGSDTMFLFVVQLITDVLWIFPIRLFCKQMDNRKYKDDVEIDATRKNRLLAVDGLILILVLAGGSAFAKNTAYNMSAYVYNTWMSQDQKLIGKIHDAFEVAYIDPAISKDDKSWEEIMATLEEGVDITTWGMPKGEYQETIAVILGIEDFSSLKSSFQSTDGPAIVYVKLENGDFSVELMNLHKVTDRVIRIK